jgi:hypothetical protein
MLACRTPGPAAGRFAVAVEIGLFVVCDFMEIVILASHAEFAVDQRLPARVDAGRRPRSHQLLHTCRRRGPLTLP